MLVTADLQLVLTGIKMVPVDKLKLHDTATYKIDNYIGICGHKWVSKR